MLNAVQTERTKVNNTTASKTFLKTFSFFIQPTKAALITGWHHHKISQSNLLSTFFSTPLMQQAT
jgi:hypothetical protein